MFCNNVSVICNHMIVTGYVLIGVTACNEYPVVVVVLLSYILTIHQSGTRTREKKLN